MKAPVENRHDYLLTCNDLSWAALKGISSARNQPMLVKTAEGTIPPIALVRTVRRQHRGQVQRVGSAAHRASSASGLSPSWRNRAVP